MAQPQPRRGDEGLQAQGGIKAPAAQQEPIKYGDAFPVKGELAGQPIAPRDAAAMRSAEDSVPGVQVPQESGGGFSAGAFMESAAAYNQAVGAVGQGQASDAVAKHGVNVTQDAVPGGRIVTEFVAGQVCMSCPASKHMQCRLQRTTKRAELLTPLAYASLIC
jgi:hypothetical protein